MKGLKFIGMTLMVIALLLGSMGVALAEEGAGAPTPVPYGEPQQSSRYQGLCGTVGEGTDWDTGTIILVTNTSGEVTIMITADTILKAPGAVDVSIDDIRDAVKLAVLAIANEDGTYNAVQVMKVPGEPIRRHLTGVVIERNEDGTFTITTPDGESYIVDNPGELKELVPGNVLAAVVRRSAGEGRMTCTGAQTMEQVRERLRTQLQQMTQSGSEGMTQNQIRTRLQIQQRLSEKMEGLAERQQSMLRNCLQSCTNDGTRQMLQQQIRKMDQVRQQVQQQIQDCCQQNTDSGSGSGTATHSGSQSSAMTQQQGSGRN